MNNKRLLMPVFVFFMFVSAVSAAVPTTTDGDDPWIRINTIGDHYVGDQFTISGTTNLPEDSDFIVEMVSSSYPADGGSHSGEYTGRSELVKVVEGDTDNEWSIDIDGAVLNPDEYIISVEAIVADCTATTTINLLEKGTTATATKTATKTATATMTATVTATSVATTEATMIHSAPTETATPGFGALAALIGLCAAATLLFLRKE